MKSRKACHCLLVASVLAALSSGVAAQQDEETQASPEGALPRLFVSDRLVLNVYSEPDQGGTRIATIETGDVVETIARSGNSVQVRLADGREGWVGASYLTTDAPAATRLRERQDATSAEAKRSAAEVTRLKKEAAALQAQIDQMKAAPVPAAAATIASVEPVMAQAPSSTSEPVSATSVSARAWPSWLWPVAIVFSLGAGFAAGYQTLARRIRRRFGGLRLY